MNVKLLDNRLLVKVTQEEKSDGGIFIPTASQEKSDMGEIVAVGSGKLMDDGNRAAMSVKTGDKVLYSKYAGTEVKLEGVDYIIIREDDVMGILG